MKWLILIGCICALLLMFQIKNCSAADTFIGAAVMGGSQYDLFWHVTSHDYKEFQFCPVYGKHMNDRWDAWLEGKLAYIDWENTKGSLKLGVLGMTSYDAVKFNDQVRLYAEAGVGIGYKSYSPSSNTLGNNPTGLFDYGVGIKYKLDKKRTAKIGLRFEHTSSMFGADTGINTYGTAFSIIW